MLPLRFCSYSRGRGVTARLFFLLLALVLSQGHVPSLAYAAPTISLSITSAQPSDSPLGIVIRCSDSEPFTLRLESAIANGTQWTVVKARDLATNTQLCDNTTYVGRIPPPPRYDLALDDTWLPAVDGTSRRYSLRAQLVRNSVVIASAEIMLDRPVGQSRVFLIGSDAFGTGVSGYGFSGTTRSRTADILWEPVAGAVGYTVCLSGPGYAGQCWNSTDTALYGVTLGGSEGFYTASVTALAPNGMRGTSATTSIGLDLSPPAAPVDIRLHNLT